MFSFMDYIGGKKTPLYCTATLPIFKILLNNNANIEAVDSFRRRPLHKACKSLTLEVVKYLIEEKNAKVDVKDDFGVNILHFACLGGNLEVARYLIEEKIVDLKDTAFQKNMEFTLHVRVVT
jgi:ankyrin repeat protein